MARVNHYTNLRKGLEELRDVEGSVAVVMRKYGECCEEEGMVADENLGLSFDDEMAIKIAGEEEEGEFWKGIEWRGGGVEAVADYLMQRFSEIYADEEGMQKEVHVVMLEWVVREAKRVEAERVAAKIEARYDC